jgi:hypothetical protein
MKKLLYITHGSNDFTDDMLFMGLDSLQNEYDVYFAISGCEFGYPQTIEERANYIVYHWKDEWISVAKKLKNINDYPDVIIDIVIIGQAWVQNQAKYFELKKLCSHNCKVLQIHAIDDNNPPVDIATQPDHIFYTNKIISWESGLYMPFLSPRALVERENNKEIKYFINCQLGLTHPCREYTVKKFYKELDQYGKLNESKVQYYGRETFGNCEKTPIDKYWDTLESSKAIVHDRGAGTDAFRFWEGIATGNYVLCSQRNFFQLNNMPIPPNVIFWRDNSDLKRLFNKIDNTSFDDLLQLRKDSKEFIKKHHTPEARLRRILEKAK